MGSAIRPNISCSTRAPLHFWMFLKISHVKRICQRLKQHSKLTFSQIHRTANVHIIYFKEHVRDVRGGEKTGLLMMNEKHKLMTEAVQYRLDFHTKQVQLHRIQTGESLCTLIWRKPQHPVLNSWIIKAFMLLLPILTTITSQHM